MRPVPLFKFAVIRLWSPSVCAPYIVRVCVVYIGYVCTMCEAYVPDS